MREGEQLLFEELKIVTSPAYMLAENISDAAEGITKAVNKVIELA